MVFTLPLLKTGTDLERPFARGDDKSSISNDAESGSAIFAPGVVMPSHTGTMACRDNKSKTLLSYSNFFL